MQSPEKHKISLYHCECQDFPEKQNIHTEYTQTDTEGQTQGQIHKIQASTDSDCTTDSGAKTQQT